MSIFIQSYDKELMEAYMCVLGQMDTQLGLRPANIYIY